MDKIYKKYQGHTIENGFSETSPDFKKFASYVKKRIKQLLPTEELFQKILQLDITLLVDFFEKMRNGRIFHLMNVEIAHLILQQRIAGKVF